MILPGGTLTFLFTDIVGSTVLWEEHPAAMAEIVPAHDVLITGAVEACGGIVFKTVGDAVCAVFETAGAAVDASVEAQQRLATKDWPAATGAISVRMGIHTGVAQRHGDSDYLGPTLNRVARLSDAGHGGQIVVSEAARSLIDFECVDLGRHQLKGLARPDRIYQLRYDGCPEQFPPLRTALAATAGNLPVNLEPIFGRSAELDSVVTALGKQRLVTLAGPGGVGKTRLALEAASLFGDKKIQDGIWLVGLAPLATGSDIYATVASTLSVQPDGGRPLADAVIAALVSRDSLLVLDNTEHVLDSARDFVARVMSSCPGIRLLVTSRESLGVRGEQVVRVPPLAVRASGGDLNWPGPAVELLQHRIALGGGVLDASSATLDSLAHIARLLEGMPLALELAAARSSVLGLDGLIDRLDGQLDILADRTALDARHTTLRATIDWSHDLLDEAEREVFRRFSVFANGCTLEAAEEVCADPSDPGTVLESIEHLVSASMVNVDIDELGRTRFSMLESLRQFGQKQLEAHDDSAGARTAHAAYYRMLAERTAAGIRTSDIQAVRELEIELANLRAAYEWGLTTDDPDLYLVVPAVYGRWFYENESNDEMAGWLLNGVDRPSAQQSPMYPMALAICVGTARARGDVAHREEYLELLRSVSGGEGFPPDAREALGMTDFYEGRVSLEDQAAYLETGDLDPVQYSEICQKLSLSYLYQNDDHERATHHAMRVLDLADQHGLQRERAWGLYALAEACQGTDPQQAIIALDEAVAISQDGGWKLVNGVSRVSLATATQHLGHTTRAARLLSDLIREWHLQGNWHHQWVALRNAVEFLAAGGDEATAAQLHHAIEQTPSSPEVFGAQRDRLDTLAAKFPTTVASPMTDDQITDSAVDALDRLALGA